MLAPCKHILFIFASVIILTVALPVYATPNLEKQRLIFTDAKKALKKGHLRTFSRLSKKLVDYPLYGYLQYDYLKKRISKVPNKRLENFLKVYEDSPMSERMRFNWLRSLYRAGKWKTFLTYYKGSSNTKLRCYNAYALYKTNKIKKANIEAENLYLVGKSQPRACDRIFKKWAKNGGMSREHKWKRIELAMDRGNSSLAKFISSGLSKRDRQWVHRWRKMHRRPADNLLRKYLHSDNPIANKIERHGIKRLARRDAGAAADAWENVHERHEKTAPEEVKAIDQYVALQAAYQQHPRALEWLGAIAVPSDKVQLWRIRAALSQQDWWAALTWIEALPTDERHSDQWRYWRARILDIQSESLPVLKTAAKRIYTALAAKRNYHGFLAADRLGIPYQMEFESLEFSREELDKIAKIPGIARATELYFIGMVSDARREWNNTISDFDELELKQASVLAKEIGWHDRAIMTVAKASHFDDLELRFPMAHKSIVEKQAREQGIEAAWIYGVLRQESGFMADARSHAGALGLMQLMPGTGRLTARSLKFRIRSNRDILNVNKNIRLGAAYLRRMMDRNDGNSVLATASYNAGPHRVKKWIPNKDTPSDLWVETIPYNETRKYVRRVMSYTMIYNTKLGGKNSIMGSRMPVIKAREGVDS
ncbi:MAG: transglycosylase SLT domain-containing protein [Gammaproteobacteria bacterium]|nr:transglycosylase SLT domain-containing protein [Gammaproteobacteria bacterium]